MTDERYQVQLLDDLQKVFLEKELTAKPCRNRRFRVLQGQRLNFQVAVKSPVRAFVNCRVDSLFASCATVRQVGVVYCDRPAVKEDPIVITSEPGVFPDPLMPLYPDQVVTLPDGRWISLWVSIDIPRECPSGRYPFRVVISTASEDVQLAWPLLPIPPEVVEVELDIIPEELPKQTLWSCSWFHTDCLQKWYKCGFEDERFWALLKNYLKDMAAHGINVLFTPLWTPPLDTAIGHERPTCQLLGITEKDGVYAFDFSLLKRWIDTARECGIERFEMVHAFTQWGAKATPKIIVNGERRFGWDVAATSPQYQDFLEQLLPKLAEFLRSQELSGKCFFHNSDEPYDDSLERYKNSLALLQKHLPDDEFPIFDALSSTKFVEEGVTLRPIPSTPHLENFMDLKLKAKWVYYCGNWESGAPNRNFGLPSWRNRVLGILLYALEREGFLHWGHNFWFSQYSLEQELNPWQNTSAGYGFLGGDSYHVYPGNNDAPVDSLHYEVFSEAMQDLRACQLLEKLTSRKTVMDIIMEGVERPLKMTDYPHSGEWVLDVMDRVLKAIDAAL